MNVLGDLEDSASCWCAGGKAYANCHLQQDLSFGRRAFQFRQSNGSIGIVHLDKPIEVEYEVESASSFPVWILGTARDFSLACAAPGAGEHNVFMAVLMAATAAEAVVNRLLEPLVDPAEWAGPKGKNGLERRSPDAKWCRLFRVLDLGDPPAQLLAALRSLLDLRNDLVHFKHGKSRQVARMPLASVLRAGRLQVDASPMLGGDPPVVESRTNLLARLRPSLAQGYFEPVSELTLMVLEKHPDDPYWIVADLRKVLTEPRAAS